MFHELSIRNLVTPDQSIFMYRSFLRRERLDQARELLKYWSDEIGQIRLPQLAYKEPLLKSELGYYNLHSDFKTMAVEKFKG